MNGMDYYFESAERIQNMRRYYLVLPLVSSTMESSPPKCLLFLFVSIHGRLRDHYWSDDKQSMSLFYEYGKLLELGLFSCDHGAAFWVLGSPSIAWKWA